MWHGERGNRFGVFGFPAIRPGSIGAVDPHDALVHASFPAIRLGLHGWINMPIGVSSGGFPAIRPGSVRRSQAGHLSRMSVFSPSGQPHAAPTSWRATTLPVFPAIRPGLHCGCPLVRASTYWRHVLPPAIRPGLHCGYCPFQSPRSWAELPPAIRPGLHCGSHDVAWATNLGSLLPPAIRPGLHCGCPVRTFAIVLRRYFPRPSGRGSIAARGSGSSRGR